MKKIIINKVKYNILEDTDGIVDADVLSEYITDYFDSFDYILGDMAYGKIRLKGFNKKENPNFNSYNDFSKIKDYIANKCAFGCKYFIIEKCN